MLASCGRYVFSSLIFDSLGSISPGFNGEYQLTDAIADLIIKGERVVALEIDEDPYDIGNPKGFTEAILMHALQNPSYDDVVKRVMAKMSTN